MPYLKGYIEKVGEDGTLAVAVASDSSVDRDGERIDANGWDFSNFLKNAVLLWAHNYREEPLGVVTELVKDGDRILFKPKFAVDVYDKAKRIYEMYKSGILNAFSVGFVPREWKDEQMPDGRRVRVYTKAELLEISCVPVPSNPNAIVLARSMGGDTESYLKGLCKDAGIALKEPEEEKPAEVADTGEETQKAIKDVAAAVETLATEVKGIREDVDAIKNATAENGKGAEGKVETQGTLEKLSPEELERTVLRAINKATGKSLREHNARTAGTK